jgi:hypothetical protein
MSTSQRVSFGFHRLAVFLAVIPLVLGVTLSAFFAYTAANREADQHQKLDCAHHVYQTNESAIWASALQPNNTDASVGLEEIGCSPNKWERAPVEQVQSPPAFTWLSAFGSGLLPGLPITLILTLAIYVLIRAIGLGHWRLHDALEE